MQIQIKSLITGNTEVVNEERLKYALKYLHGGKRNSKSEANALFDIQQIKEGGFLEFRNYTFTLIRSE